MTSGSLRNLLSRGLAVVLLAAAPALVYLGVAAPLAARYGELQRLIEDQRQVLGRLQSTPGASPSDSSPSNTEALLAKENVFMAGGSIGMTTAELQTRLGRLVEAESLAVKSARALEPRQKDGVAFIGVEMQITASNAQLQKLLLAIESQRPYLFVDAIRIAPLPIQSDEDAVSAPLLEVDVSVVGAVDTPKG